MQLLFLLFSVCPTSSSISSSSYDIITDTTVTMESIDNTLYVTFTDTPVTTMESIETSRNSTSKWRYADFGLTV